MKLISKGQDGILLNSVLNNPMLRYSSEYYKDFGIGNHPDFDEDFRNTYGLRYAPYSEVNFNGTDPSNIRLQNLNNVTAQSFLWENPTGTLLVGPDNKIINKERLSELSKLYRVDNAEALNKRYSTLRGEEPIKPVAPEFWLLTAGATKAPSALNSVISPLFNMLAVDNVISDVTPYKGWGNMMSKNIGGPEWAWDIAHPAFTKDLWNLTKYGTKIGSLYVKDAAINTAFNILDNNVSRIVKIPQVKRGIEVLARTDESLIPNVYTDFIKRLSQTLEGRQQLKANGKYILTGKSTEGVPYRTLNPHGIETNGFSLSTNFPKGKTDLLDVYFYGKLLDDDVLTYLGKGPEADFGIHTDYIDKFYSDRAKNILVYETRPREFNVKQGEVLLLNPETYIKGQYDFQPHMYTLDGRCAVDVGGHLLIVDPNLKAWQYLDIWKFNPEEYVQSWGNKWTNDNRWVYLGLKFMDKAGTPIITRTPIYCGTKLPH